MKYRESSAPTMLCLQQHAITDDGLLGAGADEGLERAGANRARLGSRTDSALCQPEPARPGRNTGSYVPQTVIMSIKDYLDTIAPAPAWLKQSWATAKRSGVATMSMRDIDGEAVA